MRCVLCLLVIFAAAGCSDRNSPAARATNIDYLKNTLGSIVLNNRDANGEVFDSFDAAHTASGVTLRNRGDYYGQSLAYIKLGLNSYQFHSYGPNGTDDGGAGDDIIVVYANGAWTPQAPNHRLQLTGDARVQNGVVGLEPAFRGRPATEPFTLGDKA